MEYYDNSDNFNERVHTIKVTLQFKQYKGSIVYEIGGNCFGKDLLDWNPECETQEEIENYVLNDCNFRVDDNGWYSFELQDKDGNGCGFSEVDDRELNDYIVAIEIIDCKRRK